MNKRAGSAWMSTVIIVGIIISAPGVAQNKSTKKKKPDGAQVFKQHCASCHAGGGNLVDDKHPVAGSKQLDSLAGFKDYLSNPPGHMPYYEDVVGDRATLDALYKFCKKLKKGPMKAASANVDPTMANGQ